MPLFAPPMIAQTIFQLVNQIQSDLGINLRYGSQRKGH